MRFVIILVHGDSQPGSALLFRRGEMCRACCESSHGSWSVDLIHQFQMFVLQGRSWRCGSSASSASSSSRATRKVCASWATRSRAALPSWVSSSSRWPWPSSSSLPSCSTRRRTSTEPISPPFRPLSGTPSSPWQLSGKSLPRPYAIFATSNCLSQWLTFTSPVSHQRSLSTKVAPKWRKR